MPPTAGPLVRWRSLFASVSAILPGGCPLRMKTANPEAYASRVERPGARWRESSAVGGGTVVWVAVGAAFFLELSFLDVALAVGE